MVVSCRGLLVVLALWGSAEALQLGISRRQVGPCAVAAVTSAVTPAALATDEKSAEPKAPQSDLARQLQQTRPRVVEPRAHGPPPRKT